MKYEYGIVMTDIFDYLNMNYATLTDIDRVIVQLHYLLRHNRKDKKITIYSDDEAFINKIITILNATNYGIIRYMDNIYYRVEISIPLYNHLTKRKIPIGYFISHL